MRPLPSFPIRPLALCLVLLPLFHSPVHAEVIEVAPQVKVFYESSGQGEPLLFLPGWTMTSGIWKDQVVTFSMTHRVIALDPRSHGNSSKALAGNSLAQQAKDMRRLIEELRLDQVTLIGWSMGVAVILEYVNQFGCDRLKGLVLVDGLPSFVKKEDWPFGFTAEEMYNTLMRVESQRVLQTNQFVDNLFKTERPESELEWIVKECMRTPTTIATVLAYDWYAVDRRAYLAKIVVPTLIMMSGEHKEAGEYMKNRIQSSKLSVFEDLGHALFLDDPKKFNETLAAFLQTLQ